MSTSKVMTNYFSFVFYILQDNQLAKFLLFKVDSVLTANCLLQRKYC